jgi:succinate dehydrogenase / fumarate reductase cytochrome b subunit
MSSEPATAPGSLRPRPLSPHLQIYRWQLTSVLSILHRASGIALSGGAVFLVWWLAAAASGPEAYGAFASTVGSILGRLFLLGWTLAFFYHLANGVRHLWWDTGRGLDLPSVYRSGWGVVAFTGAATLLAWIVAYWVRGG